MSTRAISWNSPAVVFAVVFCLVLATGTLVARELVPRSSTSKANAAPTYVSNWKDLAAVGHEAGNSNARVTLLLFADYECPACAELHKLLAVAKRSLGDTLRVVTRHFPLTIHAHATEAALAAECAALQGRFPEFEDVAYARQTTIGTTPWNTLAQDAGVRDTVEFGRCVAQQRHASVVDADLKVARTLRFSGTPAYLVNGTAHFGAPTLDELLQQLRRAASEANNAAIAAPGNAAGNAAANAAATAAINATTTPTPQRVGSSQRPRHWAAPLALERTITGKLNDELLIPTNLTVTQDHALVLFDFGSMELRAFNREGTQLWRTGRKGAGPGEFRNAMDVKMRGNGELAVLDMSNRRITTVSHTGRVIRTIPLKIPGHRLVPLADTGFYALAADDSSTLWRGVNTRGDSTRNLTAPTALQSQQGIERETFTTALGQGAVVAYRWSDKLAILNADGSVRQIVNGVEPVAFPGTRAYPLKAGKFSGLVRRINPTATTGALSVTTSHDEIFVLFGGESPNRGRIVDVYDSRSGAYKTSHLLPYQTLELVALGDEAFATLRSEPIPALDIWTAKPKARKEQR